VLALKSESEVRQYFAKLVSEIRGGSQSSGGAA
jgi:hypothetical protein